MKKLFLIMILFTSPAYAQQFDADAAYYRSMNNINQEEMARAARQYQNEAPARALAKIEMDGQRQQMEQDIESNRNEMRKMHQTMYGY